MYIIKHLRMCNYLKNKGFKVEGVLPDKNNPKYNVFLFKDTEEFREALSNYKRV